MVKVKNLLNENVWMWERGKFMNRRYMMQVKDVLVGCLDTSDLYRDQFLYFPLLTRKNF